MKDESVSIANSEIVTFVLSRVRTCYKM